MSPERCPILESILARGGEVHLPEGRASSASSIARIAGAAGITAALTFVSVQPTPAADAMIPVATSPVPGMPVMAATDPLSLVATPAEDANGPDYGKWTLRGSVGDDRIEFSSGRSSIKVRRDLAQIIVDAAHETGADPDVMMAMADKESSFDVRARTPTSSAAGLYQFLEATWLETVHRYGARHGLAEEASGIVRRGGQFVVENPADLPRILDLRLDPKLAALMACEMHMAQKSELGNRIGTEPTPGESYMAHMLGMNGASRFIKAKRAQPGAVAKTLFPAAAGSNKSIFHEGRRPRTMGEVHQVVSRQIDTRLSLYNGVTARLDPFAKGYGR